MNHFELIREGFPQTPGLDTAVSRALLGAVANGTSESVLRLHVPGAIVAFGQTDRREPGYTRAVRTARAHGFEAVQRLAGGRAAVFHTSTVAFSWAIADPAPRKRTTRRFEEIAQIISVAIRGLGLDARIGQVPGEYCPGRWSVSIGGRTKVMGVGQRVVRGAAHVGGVVVVDRSDRIRDVLVPVYRDLGLDWDPRTTGSLAEHESGLDVETVIDAIVSVFASRFEVEEKAIPDSIMSNAKERLIDHLPEVA